MPDVVLPALNEAAADRLGARPHARRLPPHRRGQRLDRRHCRDRRAARGHGGHEPVRGFGSACWAGLQAATDDIVCFMDCDASLDPVALPFAGRATCERGEADLVIGARIASRGRWPVHARIANRVLAAEVRRRPGCACATSGRCGRLDVSRCWRWTCATVDRAGRWRWCCAPHGAGWRCATCPSSTTSARGARR